MGKEGSELLLLQFISDLEYTCVNIPLYLLPSRLCKFLHLACTLYPVKSYLPI